MNLTYPKIRRPKICLLMFASLVALDGFHQLLSTQMTTNLTPEWSGGSLFHPLSHIYAKTHFCCVKTVENNVLNHRHVAIFDRPWANAAPTLNIAFLLTNVHAKWWIHCLLISSTLVISCNFNLRSSKTRLWSFFLCVFSGTTAVKF